jgi:hypothetical protein
MTRAAALARILDTMPTDQREPFRDRHRALGILTRQTATALPPPTETAE